MKTKVILIAAAAVVCMALSSAPRAAEKAKGKEEIKYLGNKQCLMCHEGRDNAPSVWKASKHAGAYETLASEKAKKLSKDAQNDPKCVPCHVAGWGKAGGYSPDMEEKDKASRKGVTCEVCHGPGQKYVVLMVKAKANDEHLTTRNSPMRG